MQRMRFELTAASLLAIISAAIFWLLPGKDSARMFAPSLLSSAYSSDAARVAVQSPSGGIELDLAAAPLGSLTHETRDKFLARFMVDPLAAIEWLIEHSDGDSRRSLIGDPEIRDAFKKAANDLSRAGDQADADFVPAQHFLQQWAALDTGAALDWIHQQPAGDRRDAFVVRIIFVLSKQDPAKAAHWVIDEMEPGPAQDESAISVLHQWALQDFDGARSWVQKFPEGPLRERAIGELKGAASYLQSRSQAY